MADALISVILPVFNAAPYLREAVESVRAQSYGPLEIICVDDGSTDDSATVARATPNTRYYHQENAGPAAARNLGIRHAKGEILGFLDADDRWTNQKLALQLPILCANPHVHLVAGRVEEFYEADQLERHSRTERRSGDRAYTAGALLVRRTEFIKVGPFDTSLRMGEFMEWRSRALACGLREHVVDTVVLQRRVHGQNTTLKRPDLDKDYLSAIRLHLQRNRGMHKGKETGST